MSAEVAVADYYEALRRGEPLYPYFFESSETYKAAISTSYLFSRRESRRLRRA